MLRCLNLASYNYLGFAAQDPYCTPRVEATLEDFGPASCSSRVDAGGWVSLPCGRLLLLLVVVVVVVALWSCCCDGPYWAQVL